MAERLSVAEATEKLGIYPSQIYGWRSAQNYSRTRPERESVLATENARLKRQLAEKAEELDILKKAAVDSTCQRNTLLNDTFWCLKT